MRPEGSRRAEALRPSLALLLALAACWPFPCERPGEGARAEAGYRACAPLNDALARYHADRGAWPATLAELVPRYLDHAPARDDVTYRRTADGYELGFSYAGPGMNHCTFKPASGWKCYGYY